MLSKVDLELDLTHQWILEKLYRIQIPILQHLSLVLWLDVSHLLPSLGTVRLHAVIWRPRS